MGGKITNAFKNAGPKISEGSNTFSPDLTDFLPMRISVKNIHPHKPLTQQQLKNPCGLSRPNFFFITK